jgi:FkbM family methyltransferase
VIKLLGETFRVLRRWVRILIIHSPLLDKVLGDLLRSLERQFPNLFRHLLGSLSTGQVTCHGSTLTFRQQDMGVVSTILLYGNYEPETTNAVRTILGPGMCFVDLGAHIGYFTLLGAQVVGSQGKVYAFEPVPGTCDVLATNVVQNGYSDRVVIVPKAVSDSGKVINFSIDKDSSVSNKIASNKHAMEDVTEVEAISLDEFFSVIGWPGVNLVKMDIEGLELAALQGMEELVRRNPFMRLIFEFHKENLKTMDTDPGVLFHLLQSYGFRRFRVLYRHYDLLEIPRDIPVLTALAKRANVNILAERM